MPSPCPPVLFVAFNRPAETVRVLNRILEANPVKLYIAADGPRSHVPTDHANCQETRREILRLIGTRPCATLFREKNLGCREAVSSAITWFFEHEERGIILEDDCMPQTAFFDYMKWAFCLLYTSPSPRDRG